MIVAALEDELLAKRSTAQHKASDEVKATTAIWRQQSWIKATTMIRRWRSR
jgi:hypothetical protein